MRCVLRSGRREYSTWRSKQPSNNSILVLNAGSSSLKYKVFSSTSEPSTLSVSCHGKFEQKANANQQLEYHYTHNDATNGVQSITDTFTNTAVDRLDYVKCIDILFNELLAPHQHSNACITIGHRIVHGGDTFCEPQLIDNSVLQTIEKYSQIAPLHNPFQLECILAIDTQSRFHIDAQFAVFDTAFHAKMPDFAYKYALNAQRAEQYQQTHGIQLRRYGFHGISYQSILERTAKYLSKLTHELNVIALHLGSGCSFGCAALH